MKDEQRERHRQKIILLTLKMEKKENKSTFLFVLCTPQQKKLIQSEADAERRSLSSYVLNSVLENIKGDAQ